MPIDARIPMLGNDDNIFKGINSGLARREARDQFASQEQQRSRGMDIQEQDMEARMNIMREQVELQRNKDAIAASQARVEKRAKETIPKLFRVESLVNSQGGIDAAIRFAESNLSEVNDRMAAGEKDLDNRESTELVDILKRAKQSGDRSEVNALFEQGRELGKIFGLESAKYSAISVPTANGGMYGINTWGRPWAVDAKGEPIVGEALENMIRESNEVEVAHRGAIKRTEAQIMQSINLGTKAFEMIEPLRLSISNLDEAIGLIQGGTQTGPLMSRLPSLRSGAIMLDNLQKRMGIDIVSAVTFGALSKGELDLALTSALPQDLSGEPLIEWLKSRREQQIKLLNFHSDAASFLSTGRPLTEFLVRGRSNGDGSWTMENGDRIERIEQ